MERKQTDLSHVQWVQPDHRLFHAASWSYSAGVDVDGTVYARLEDKIDGSTSYFRAILPEPERASWKPAARFPFGIVWRYIR